MGRQAELGLLTNTVAGLDAPGPVAVLIGGEAGVGKTRLVAEMAEGALATGVRVLTGSCLALGAESLPYAPFTQALGELAEALGPDGLQKLVGPVARADLARLVPSLDRNGGEARAGGATDRAVLFQAVLGVLEAAAADAPIVLVLEDLHWSDASTRELLGFLMRRLRSRVLIVGTFRSDELHRRHPLRPLIAEATRDERVMRLQLAALEPEEVAEQLEAISGERPLPEVIAAVVARAEGNPFFAEELFAAGGGEQLPPGLSEVLAAHLGRLPENAYEVVRVAAVAGRRVSHELLSAICHQSTGDLVAGLREATFHHVLVADRDGTYAFRHALLQEAAYAELLPGERTVLHAACADALAHVPDRGGAPSAMAGELAHHYAAAHDPLRALTASVEAAAAALDSAALGEAHALYEQALAMWARADDPGAVTGLDHVTLLERCADAALLAGAEKRAIALVRSALTELDAVDAPGRAAMLHWRLARLLWTGGDGEASLAAHREAVALMPSAPSAERALILAAEGHVLMLSGRYQQARARCEEAIAVARVVGAQREEGYALNTLGGALSGLGEPEAAATHLEEALAIAEAVGSIDDIRRGYGNLLAVLAVAGQLERSADVGRAGVSRLEELGYDEGAATLRCWTAGPLKDAGAWEEADRLAAEALKRPVSDYTEWCGREVRGTIAVRRGDFAAAHRLLDEARSLWSTGDADFRAELDAAVVELALLEGRIDVARAVVDEGLVALAGSDAQDSIQRFIALGLRAEADAASDKRGRSADARTTAALARAERLVAHSRTLNAELLGRGVARTHRDEAHRPLCEAEYARARGRHEPELWARAARVWSELSHPYESAYARRRQAEAHLAKGEKPEAASALREAYGIASRLGAGPLVKELEALARRARVRLATAQPDPQRHAAGDSLLSSRELEVLALIAAGHTNREIAEQLFITSKTASAHVSHILTKLGVSNRGQATAAAHRLGLLRDATGA